MPNKAQVTSTIDLYNE